MKKLINKNIDLGFEVKLIFKQNISEKEFDKVTDSFILEAIEKNDLMFGGGGYLNEYSGFITSANENKVVGKTDIDKIKKWIIKNKNIISNFKIGKLKDANE